MKKVLLPAFIALVPFLGIAQETDKRCGSYEVEKTARLLHPETEASRLELEQFTKDFIKNKNKSAAPPPYIIPVVFHIIHTYGSENISDAQVYDAMAVLNRDFMRLNPDTADVVPEFQDLIGFPNIQFRLATKDVAGNCTNGIEHIYSYKANIAGDGTKLNPWQRDRYLNIWVAAAMISGASAYAYKPASVNVTGPFSKKDGIIALHDYVGRIGTGSEGLSRTLTHEIGHYLNLSHVWGDGDYQLQVCGDDGVADTPLSPGWLTCDLAHANHCDSAIIENVQNYMEYSFCNKMFTPGQVDLMHAALNSSVSGRSNLWQEANLEQTGTAAPYSPPLCAPLSDFHADRLVACAGDQVKLFDNSQRAAVDSRVWSIPGATPETSTLPTPTFTFPNPGNYSVTLTTTNATGSDTKTISDYITVRESWANHTVPYTQDFSNYNDFYEWTAKDLFNDNHSWKLNTTGGFGGGNAVCFNNWQGDEGVYDELISPSFDLTYSTNIKVNYKYSVATYASDLKESLSLYVSSNCGKTWSLIPTSPTSPGTLKGNALFSASQWDQYYVPNSDQYWADASVSVPSAFNKKPNVRFKFVFTGTGNGNNAWLDNFSVDATVGIDDKLTAISYLSVYPNPTVDEIGIRFEKLENSTAKVKVLNMLGQELHSQDLGFLAIGEHDLKVNANLSNGMYILMLESGSSKMQSRFVVNK